jgi:hypothetical protein
LGHDNNNAQRVGLEVDGVDVAMKRATARAGVVAVLVTCLAIAAAPPAHAAVTGGGGSLSLSLGFSPGIAPASAATSGTCASDTVTATPLAVPLVSGTSGGAVVNTGNNSFTGLVSVSFSATSTCSNFLGDSSASTVVTLSGSNPPSSLSCSFNAFYTRDAVTVGLVGSGTCKVDGVSTGNVLLSAELALTPVPPASGVVTPMTGAMATGAWVIEPGSS